MVKQRIPNVTRKNFRNDSAWKLARCLILNDFCSSDDEIVEDLKSCKEMNEVIDFIVETANGYANSNRKIRLLALFAKCFPGKYYSRVLSKTGVYANTYFGSNGSGHHKMRASSGDISPQ